MNLLHHCYSLNTLAVSPLHHRLPPDHWPPPSSSQIKLNFDGYFNPIGQSLGIGGILRDHERGGYCCILKLHKCYSH